MQKILPMKSWILSLVVISVVAMTTPLVASEVPLPAKQDFDATALLSGRVFNGEGQLPLEGALVSAQVKPTGSETGPRVENATITNAEGDYQLFLPPGRFQIVVVDEYYSPLVVQLNLKAGEIRDLDFHLAPSLMGVITGEISSLGHSANGTVTLSFRQLAISNDGGVIVEVGLLEVGVGEFFEAQLPQGEYQIVASMPHGPEQEIFMTLGGDEEVRLDFEI